MTSIISLSAKTLHLAGNHLVEIVPVTTNTVPPYTTTNAVFFGQTGFFVIDPGTPHEDQQALLRTYIELRQRRGHRFLGIGLTHHHGDHTRAAEYLSDHFKVSIYAHRLATQFVSFSVTPIDNNQALSDNHDPQLCALYTPGHSADHMVFYARESGILIAGDMITDRGTILIPPNSGSLRIYLESLEMLSTLDLAAVVPAHGLAITKDARRFLLRAMKHRYERIKAVYDAIKNQNASLDATDITRLVYRDTTPENLMVFAQLNVESSLQWLKEANLVGNPDHFWRASREDRSLETEVLLDRLKQIDERLGNT